MGESSFSSRVYELLKKVPSGKVTTYQALAHALGSRAYRAVGSCMRKNPSAPRVPCHRVVNADGRLGGYAFGLKRKIALLRSEGVGVSDGKIVDFDKVFFSFS